MDTLPAFLLPPTSPNSNAPLTPLAPLTDRERADLARVKRENELMLFPALFERILDAMCAGSTFAAAFREENIHGLNEGVFKRWVHGNDDRQAAYDAAAKVRTYTWVDRAVEHAIASNSLEDVNRSKLIVDTYKWQVALDNRLRFGETKQVEHKLTADLVSAMEEGNRRALERRGDVIDVQGRTV